jgi:metabolite-proton symporter
MVVADIAVAEQPRTNSLAKVGLISVAATSIEWYDFFIYGTAAALVFPKLFFPATLSPLVAQLASFSTFAVGFIARPIGGVLFGHFGDMIGRKRALVVALVLMGLSSALVGLLPSYALIGAAAPMLLVALRFCQGLAIGGQWGGAALMAVENAPRHRRGLFGSLPQLGVPAGMITANIVFLAMTGALSPDAFQSWGWRAPFALSVLLVAVGLYVQGQLHETPEFVAAADAVAKHSHRRSPVIQVLARQPRQVLLAAGSFIACNGSFYLLTTFSIAYATTTLHLPRAEALWAVLIACVIISPFIVLSGALSDRYGRRAVYLVGCVLGIVGAFVMWPLIDTGAFALIVLGLLAGFAGNSVTYGPQPALFCELFSTELRYSGASLGYQIGAIFGGGFAPIVATALIARFHTSMSVAVYLAAMYAVSLVSVVLLTESRQR